MFPKARSEFFSNEAIRFTTSSGVDVPKPTIVRPITIDGIFNRFAREEALSTKRFAPIINGTNPTNNNKRYHIKQPLLS
jgi:hypothetical protein